MRPGRRLKLALALLALGAIAPSCAAGATWQFAPAEAPPPPPGAAQQSLPVPLGKVGAISFWSPNRGVLIDEGTATDGCRTANATAGVPCGLYAYNGRGWHLLSTVCGGGEGRIAWGGPEDFWTISDQTPELRAETKPAAGTRAASPCATSTKAKSSPPTRRRSNSPTPTGRWTPPPASAKTTAGSAAPWENRREGSVPPALGRDTA